MSKPTMDGFEGVSTMGSGGSGAKTPLVKITNAAGNYLRGVLSAKRSRDSGQKNDKGEPKMDFIATFKLIETDTLMVMGTGKKDSEGKNIYAPVAANAGDEVTIYGAPSRLTNALNKIELGREVLIVYEGKKKEVVNGRSVFPHIFKVGQKAAATPEAADAGVPD